VSPGDVKIEGRAEVGKLAKVTVWEPHELPANAAYSQTHLGDRVDGDRASNGLLSIRAGSRKAVSPQDGHWPIAHGRYHLGRKVAILDEYRAWICRYAADRRLSARASTRPLPPARPLK